MIGSSSQSYYGLPVRLEQGKFRDFAESVFDELDVSEATRYDYKNRVSVFIQYLSEYKDFSPNVYLHFKRYLETRNDLSISTKNKYLTVARVFLKSLHKYGYLPVDTTVNVRSFQQSKRHKVEGLNQEEISQVFEYLNGLASEDEKYRLLALFSLLVFQGLRQIEIVRLDVKHLDLPSKRLSIRGKGRDDTEPIDLHPITSQYIKRYLKTNLVADGPLFPSKSNCKSGSRMTTRGLRKIIKQIFEDLSIEKNVHGLRHFFVTKLVESYGGDLLEVARYTRHKSIETLQVYNDSVNRKRDLPRYYKAFSGLLS